LRKHYFVLKGSGIDEKYNDSQLPSQSSILASSAHHIIPHHVYNPEVHYCVHKLAADPYPK